MIVSKGPVVDGGHVGGVRIIAHKEIGFNLVQYVTEISTRRENGMYC